MLLLFIVTAIFSVAPLSVLAGDPEVSISRIENLPNRLFYFDDTPVSCIIKDILDLANLSMFRS